ncbi:hypothetical protein GCM10017056_48880 [Seohaeicola zhoushanensis]|uniref:HTH marR-type domain-containing protein n=2 Tax=Seohaeicola zhoushanensis TaxID=1569283 RepID=A0A8J3H370_9RHOB|nr:hypothetical protein GCM10017056_48880 [Seohaeicola zhoushanensis]
MLTRHGVTEQQWRVMRVLRETGEVDATKLAVIACVLAPSLSRILSSLKGSGLIHVRHDPEDRRRSLISISESGEAFLKEVAPESSRIYAEIEDRIGLENIARMLDDIEQLLKALDRSADQANG